MSDIQKCEVIKVNILFDNGQSYEVSSDENEDKAIMEFSNSDSEAMLSGNPIGVISSNSINLKIYDSQGRLNINNKNSPFFGYMRNGVEIKVSISSDGVVFSDYGKYYVSDWQNSISDITGREAEIYALDRLQYVGNEEIPKLPIYSGVSVGTLVGQVLQGVGLTESEYSIDTSLDTNMLFGVTIGNKVRDFLNQVAQALLARVTVGKDNVIKITSALSTSDKTWTLSDSDIYNVTFKHNTSNIYNKVRVNYSNPGDGSYDHILQLTGITLETGVNTFQNLGFSNKAIDIQQVYFETPSGSDDEAMELDDISWTAYQGGIDVSVTNNSGSQLTECSLVILGRSIGNITSNEISEITGTDTKIANILDIQNEIIQNKDTASKTASNLSKYLSATNKIITIDCSLTPMAECGDKLILECGTSELSGTYKIIEANTTFGLGVYSRQVSLVTVQREV